MFNKALNNRQGRLPSLEQTGMAMGPPRKAPTGHAVTVTAWEEARSAAGMSSRWNVFRNYGRTRTPLMTPTE